MTTTEHPQEVATAAASGASAGGSFASTCAAGVSHSSSRPARTSPMRRRVSGRKKMTRAASSPRPDRTRPMSARVCGP